MSTSKYWRRKAISGYLLYYTYACAYHPIASDWKNIQNLRNNIKISPSDRILQDALNYLVNNELLDSRLGEYDLMEYRIAQTSIDTIERILAFRLIRSRLSEINSPKNYSPDNEVLEEENAENMYEFHKSGGLKSGIFYEQFLDDVLRRR